MDYKHECYDLEKLLLADDELLLYLLGSYKSLTGLITLL